MNNYYSISFTCVIRRRHFLKNEKEMSEKNIWFVYETEKGIYFVINAHLRLSKRKQEYTDGTENLKREFQSNVQ